MYKLFVRTAKKMFPVEKEIQTSHPNGHFYSPVVNPADLLSRTPSIWPLEVPPVLGIDFNRQAHETVLDSWFPRHISKYDYPEIGDEHHHDEKFFYTRNSQFSWLDSRSLFVFLNEIRPARMIEVGSGYSSLLAADVNRRFLNYSCEFQCIEPYPRDFLVNGVAGISELITKKVQDVPLSDFGSLNSGDILFIDSSHVCKTGSDVNFLYFEVLPRLKPGVFVHVHDIFLPMEYPREWVIEENRSWNEQYLLRALLMYSDSFKVFLVVIMHFVNSLRKSFGRLICILARALAVAASGSPKFNPESPCMDFPGSMVMA